MGYEDTAVQPPVKHSRPDIVLWDHEKKKCTLDVNVSSEEKVKCARYFLLESQLQRLYPQYTL